MQRTLATACALGLLVLVCVNFLGGDTGLIAQWRLEQKITALEDELLAVRREQAYWQRKVDALDPENVDLDMLGEQARRVLFFSQENEVVVDLSIGLIGEQ